MVIEMKMNGNSVYVNSKLQWICNGRIIKLSLSIPKMELKGNSVYLDSKQSSWRVTEW